ncbi:very short patch repair endonuclease [Sporobacter termitidis]|uniref:very short patch repair endonuclease n=1 Tax=Sporobacter termitidis TaxID=44749 RepID=UPI000934E2FA|nr:very short patch repair endonuclease [Sporobacter termitidis]
MDNLTKEQRKKSMTAIKSKDTSIELLLRKALWGEKIRYRKNFAGLPGKPDIAITKYHIAIFCDSEFWHGHDWENARERIHTNRDYWIPKIEKNIHRDQQVNNALAEKGWTVLRFWEKQIRKDTQSCINTIIIEIEKQK